MLGEEDPTDERSFARQSVLKRAIVLTAGSLTNLAVPVVIFAVVAALPQDVPVGTVTVTGVAPGSPAAQAGIRPGDQVLSIDGQRVRNHFDLIERTTVKLGAEVELGLRRGSIVSGLGSSPESAVVETVSVVPRLNPPEMTVVEVVTDPDTQVSLREARRYNAELTVGDTMTQGAVGVMIGTANVRMVKERQPVVESVPGAVGRTRDVLFMIKNSFQQWAVGGPNPGFTGPIGIAPGDRRGRARRRVPLSGTGGLAEHQPRHNQSASNPRSRRWPPRVRRRRMDEARQANLSAHRGPAPPRGLRTANWPDRRGQLLRHLPHLVRR